MLHRNNCESSEETSVLLEFIYPISIYENNFMHSCLFQITVTQLGAPNYAHNLCTAFKAPKTEALNEAPNLFFITY